MSDNLKLLRYNTGTDKKVLIKFKDSFSAVIFNATIVAYSKSAVADLVAVHKNRYIMFSKVDEWNDVESKSFDMLKNDLLKGYSEYCPALSNHMQDWCSIYG